MEPALRAWAAAHGDAVRVATDVTHEDGAGVPQRDGRDGRPEPDRAELAGAARPDADRGVRVRRARSSPATAARSPTSSPTPAGSSPRPTSRPGPAPWASFWKALPPATTSAAAASTAPAPTTPGRSSPAATSISSTSCSTRPGREPGRIVQESRAKGKGQIGKGQTFGEHPGPRSEAFRFIPRSRPSALLSFALLSFALCPLPFFPLPVCPSALRPSALRPSGPVAFRGPRSSLIDQGRTRGKCDPRLMRKPSPAEGCGGRARPARMPAALEIEIGRTVSERTSMVSLGQAWGSAAGHRRTCHDLTGIVRRDNEYV